MKLTCPNCGASADDVEFLTELPLSGSWSAAVTEVRDGVLVLEGLSNNSEPTTDRLTIYCPSRRGGCGHSWRSTRPWKSETPFRGGMGG